MQCLTSYRAGSDAKISGSKIDPLSSDVKTGVPSAESSGGVAGTDHNVDQARIEPVGGAGVYLSTCISAAETSD
jgi:hypothetical protein